MTQLRTLLDRSPFTSRAIPYVVFVVLTALQGKLGPESYFWVYAAKTFVGAFLVWLMWPLVREMRWAFSWEAVAMGVFVFVFWVGLDPYMPKLDMFKSDHVWNPHAQFGQGSAIALSIIFIRIIGSTLVVPPLEEVFFRSFLYRYIIKPDFLTIPLNQFHLVSFLVTAAMFGFIHGNQWPQGILCAFCYQWLVFRKNRLGDAMTAHAITNLLLGGYVAWKAQWQFW